MSGEENLEDKFWFTAVCTVVKKLSKKRLKRMEEEDFYVIKRVFEGVDGSWAGMAEGKVEEWQRLREACKSFFRVRKEKNERPCKQSEEEKE